MRGYEPEFNALRDWLFEAALPLWSETGIDRVDGGFIEKLTVEGHPTDDPRRARLVGRQIFSFATSVRLGWTGPGRDVVRHGLEALQTRHLSGERVIPLVTAAGVPLSERFDLYDQAFVVFGLAAAARIGERREPLTALAARLRTQMGRTWKHPIAGFEEASPRTLPLKANPHMHMLEASLAWVDAGGDEGWQVLADEIAELCLSRFLDPATGALHEYFDGDWGVVRDEALDVVEPGHQFEWAWLLIRWGLDRQRPDAIEAARRLVAIAEDRGVASQTGLAVNALNADLSIRDPMLRLWPQTERIKAHLALGTMARDETEAAWCEAKAADAARGLARFLDHPVAGAWWEHLDPAGQAVREPARASSLYHITCAIAEMDQPLGSRGRDVS